MKFRIILLNLLLVTLGLQAAQPGQPSTKQCELWQQNLTHLEQKLLPRNKQLVIKEERATYKIIINNIQQDLNQLQALAADEQKLIDWYKEGLQDMLSWLEESKKRLQESLDPKNANKVVEQYRKSLSYDVQYRQSQLSIQRDPKIRQRLQKAIAHDTELLRSSDKELLNVRVQKFQKELDDTDAQITEITNKMNSKQLSADAYTEIKVQIDQDNLGIKELSKYVSQTDDQIYDDVKNSTLTEINALKDSLKKCN